MRILTNTTAVAVVLAFVLAPNTLSFAQEKGDEPKKPYRGQLEEAGGVEEVELVECEVPWICSDGEYPVDQSSSFGEIDNPDGPDYCQECYDMLGCDQDCGTGTKTCCTSSNPTGLCSEYGLEPECNTVTRVIKPYLYQPPGMEEKFGFSVISEGGILYSFFGVGAESKLPFAVHGANREDEWDMFELFAKKHGGILPGSLRTRSAPLFLYRVYVRVQSEKDGTIYDQEVESIKTDHLEAIACALDTAADLKHYLELVESHTKVKILHGHRTVRQLNTLTNACRATIQCRHRCRTRKDNKTIQTSRFGPTLPNACAAAGAAAIVLADPYGGVAAGTCAHLPPVAGSVTAATKTACPGCQATSAEAETKSVLDSTSTLDDDSENEPNDK